MMCVYVVGMCRTEFHDLRDLHAGCEVWTCNDYYSVCHWLNPKRIYNIHTKFNDYLLRKPNNRFVDWRNKYNNSGAEIVVSENLGVKNQRFLNIEGIKSLFGTDAISSSISVMLSEAVLEGNRRINIYGVRLDHKGEYSFQLPGFIRIIEKAREMGVEINWTAEKKLNRLVDWAKVKAINPMAYAGLDKVKVEVVKW